MGSAFRTRRRQPRPWRDIGRLAGCFWLMLAGWAFVGVAGALGVGLDVTPLLGPLVLLPLLIALFVVAGGRSLTVLAISTVAALVFAGLGVWNYFRADEFEQTHPGSVDITGHDVLFVFLAVMTAVWSLGAIALLLRARRLDRRKLKGD